MMNESVMQLAEILKENTNIVAFVCNEMIEDCGYNIYISNEAIYEVEAKYKYSMVDLYSARFYETRTVQFFDAYRDIILQEYEPGAGFAALKKLQDMGKIRSIICKDIYDTAKRGGCRDTIAINGSIYENKCPKCNKPYDVSHIWKCKGVPVCDKCEVKIRPNVLLIGEDLDNLLMTRAVSEIEAADVLLLLGANINSVQVENFTNCFTGKKFVIIADRIKSADKVADLTIEGRVDKILPEAVEAMQI